MVECSYCTSLQKGRLLQPLKASKDVSPKDSQVFAATVIRIESLEQRRLCADLVWDYNILFGIVVVQPGEFLTCVSYTAHVIDIGWTSVCPSVTRWYCVETAQPIVKLSYCLIA